MANVRRNLHQRLEDESAIKHSGMWDHELRRVDADISKQEDIDVDDARSSTNHPWRAYTAHVAFDLLQHSEEL